MWNFLKRMTRTIYPLSNAPPADPADSDAPNLEMPVGSVTADNADQSPGSNDSHAAATVGPEQLGTLAKMIAKRLFPLMDRLAQDVANRASEVTLDSHSKLEKGLNAAVEQINDHTASRIADEARGLKEAAGQSFDALPAHLTQALEKNNSEHWSALAKELKEACSVMTQRATLRPVIDLILALLDRIGDERAFLSIWFRRDPELASHLGCRQLFDRYDNAVQSFTTEIHMILRTLDVHPLPGCSGPFNPHHQRIIAVEATTNPDLDGHVARIVRAGFTWNGTLLRHEQVIVFKRERLS